MMRIQRTHSPACLRLAKKQKWSAGFVLRRKLNPKNRFRWRKIKGQAIYPEVLLALQRMTANHCSYCDGFPLGVISGRTIDHFKPSSLFPELVYAWRNLFLCCEQCQRKKSDRYHEALLPPDKRWYRFKKYFIYEPFTGELRPNPRAVPAHQQAATITIEYLDLNAPDLKTDRKRWFRCSQDREINERPYRFLYLKKDHEIRQDTYTAQGHA